MTGKGRRKGKRKKEAKPIYLQVWFQAICLGVLLAGVATAMVFAFQPESSDKLYARAKELMESKNPEDHQEAYKGPLNDYNARFAGSKSEPQYRKDQVAAWRQQCEVEQCEEVLGILLRNRFAQPKNDAERDAQRAAKAEESGDLADAREKWGRVQSAGYTGWDLLAGQRLKDLQAVDQYEKEAAAWLAAQPDNAPAPAGPNKEPFEALRLEREGELGKARDAFAALKSASGDPEKRFWRLLAAKKMRDIDRKKDDKPPGQ
jgi:hypothetical protein